METNVMECTMELNTERPRNKLLSRIPSHLANSIQYPVPVAIRVRIPVVSVKFHNVYNYTSAAPLASV